MSTRNLSTDRKALSDTLSLIPRLKQYPLGAMLGIVTAATMNYAAPELTPEGWMQAPFTLACVAAGILVERSAHYVIGWYLDPKVHHLAASREARIQLAKLRGYEKAGTITAAEARKIAAKIAKRDVAGGSPTSVGKPRGPYKKRIDPPTRAPAA